MQTINVMKWTAMWLPLACDTSVLLVHAGNCWLKISITWISVFISTNCMNISRDGLQTLQMPSDRNLMECKHLMPDPDVFQALLSISVDRQAKVMATLQKISKEVIITIKHQLKDFIKFMEGGRHYEYDVTDPELRQRMKHRKLTNLVGEQALRVRDLDFSIFKWRYASLHHHSTMQMMKRNKPISMWFSSKDEEEQKCLLNLRICLLRRPHYCDRNMCWKKKTVLPGD